MHGVEIGCLTALLLMRSTTIFLEAVFLWSVIGGSGSLDAESVLRSIGTEIIAALIGVFIALVAARTLANTLPFRARPMYAAGNRLPSTLYPA